MILRSVDQVDVRRISPDDSNYFALLLDPLRDDIDPVVVVEIFTVGGATPPNRHERAHEIFYVLAGEGVARCAGEERIIRQGDTLMLRPGTEHVIANTGIGKLYTLTVMMPDEDFAALIRNGERLALDAEDRAVLLGTHA